ncbi:hypothetical protein NKH77_44425 [Streptomyces sp. M19]
MLPAETGAPTRALDVGTVPEGDDAAVDDLAASLLPVLVSAADRPRAALRGRQWWRPSDEDTRRPTRTSGRRVARPPSRRPVAHPGADGLPPRPVVLVTGGFGASACAWRNNSPAAGRPGWCWSPGAARTTRSGRRRSAD